MSDDDTKKPLEKYEEKLVKVLDPSVWFSWVYRRKVIPEGEIEYAGFNDRVFASAVDFGISLFLLWSIFFRMARILFGDERAVQLYSLGLTRSPDDHLAMIQSPGYWFDYTTNSLMQLAVYGVIFVWLWSRTSGTPGKWLLRMRVVDAETGKRPTTRQSIIRFVGAILASLPLFAGLFAILFDKRKQGWHDKMAGTVVVKVKHWRITPSDVSEFPDAYFNPPAEDAPEEA